MNAVLRYGLALGVCAIFAAVGDWSRLQFAFGWWAGFAWLLITKQWRPFA
jgi:hypothetical protein